MTSQGIFVAMPIYQDVHPECMISVARLIGELGVPIHLDTVQGCPLLGHARAELVSRFMRSPFDRLLWLDADVAFAPETIKRLLASERDFIGAAYSSRQGAPYPLVDRPLDLAPDESGIAEVEWVAGGLTLVRRRVFGRLIQAHPELVFRGRGSKAEEPVPFLYHPFDPFHPEDISFCRRWRAIGGKIHALLDCETVHYGIEPHALHGLQWLERMKKAAERPAGAPAPT